MEVVFHTDQLEGLLRDYHLVTGLRVGVYTCLLYTSDAADE